MILGPQVKGENTVSGATCTAACTAPVDRFWVGCTRGTATGTNYTSKHESTLACTQARGSTKLQRRVPDKFAWSPTRQPTNFRGRMLISTENALITRYTTIELKLTYIAALFLLGKNGPHFKMQSSIHAGALMAPRGATCRSRLHTTPQALPDRAARLVRPLQGVAGAALRAVTRPLLRPAPAPGQQASGPEKHLQGQNQQLQQHHAQQHSYAVVDGWNLVPTPIPLTRSVDGADMGQAAARGMAAHSTITPVSNSATSASSLAGSSSSSSHRSSSGIHAVAADAAASPLAFTRHLVAASNGAAPLPSRMESLSWLLFSTGREQARLVTGSSEDPSAWLSGPEAAELLERVYAVGEAAADLGVADDLAAGNGAPVSNGQRAVAALDFAALLTRYLHQVCLVGGLSGPVCQPAARCILK